LLLLLPFSSFRFIAGLTTFSPFSSGYDFFHQESVFPPGFSFSALQRGKVDKVLAAADPSQSFTEL